MPALPLPYDPALLRGIAEDASLVVAHMSTMRERYRWCREFEERHPEISDHAKFRLKLRKNPGQAPALLNEAMQYANWQIEFKGNMIGPRLPWIRIHPFLDLPKDVEGAKELIRSFGESLSVSNWLAHSIRAVLCLQKAVLEKLSEATIEAASPTAPAPRDEQAAAPALGNKTAGNDLSPGARVLAAAYELQKERKPISLRAACDRAGGVDRANLRKKYPEAVDAVRRMKAPDRTPRRGMRNRRTGDVDAVDDSED